MQPTLTRSDRVAAHQTLATPSGDISSAAADVGGTLPWVSARPPRLIGSLQKQMWLQLRPVSGGGRQGAYTSTCVSSAVHSPPVGSRSPPPSGPAHSQGVGVKAGPRSSAGSEDGAQIHHVALLESGCRQGEVRPAEQRGGALSNGSICNKSLAWGCCRSPPLGKRRQESACEAGPSANQKHLNHSK